MMMMMTMDDDRCGVYQKTRGSCGTLLRCVVVVVVAGLAEEVKLWTGETSTGKKPDLE